MNPAVIILGSACLALAVACAVLVIVLLRRASGPDAGFEALEKRLELGEKSRADAEMRLRSELTDLITRQNSGLTDSIGEKLSAVSRSVGEMKESSKTITDSVATLNRLMSNVKERGTWAEVRLEHILESAMPGLYERNYKPDPKRGDIVEFALRLPAENGETAMLPIDSKFPTEDYLRLCEASEAGDEKAVEEARKALKNKVLTMARDVSKYVSPPETAPYAVLYLATEGLYLEVISMGDLTERIMRDFSVLVAGPVTIIAVLDTIELAFRNAGIIAKSDEIIELLGKVQKDHETFRKNAGELKTSLEKDIEKLDKLIKRSEQIDRKLSKLETDPNNDLEEDT